MTSSHSVAISSNWLISCYSTNIPPSIQCQIFIHSKVSISTHTCVYTLLITMNHWARLASISHTHILLNRVSFLWTLQSGGDGTVGQWPGGSVASLLRQGRLFQSQTSWENLCVEIEWESLSAPLTSSVEVPLSKIPKPPLLQGNSQAADSSKRQLYGAAIVSLCVKQYCCCGGGEFIFFPLSHWDENLRVNFFGTR